MSYLLSKISDKAFEGLRLMLEGYFSSQELLDARLASSNMVRTKGDIDPMPKERVVRCNYEKVCSSLGMSKDPREFCIRCSRYIPHPSHTQEYVQIPNFLRDFSKL